MDPNKLTGTMTEPAQAVASTTLPTPGFETVNPNDSPYAFGPNPAVVTSNQVTDISKQNVTDLTTATTPKVAQPGGVIVDNKYVNPKGVLTDARTGQPVLTMNADGSKRNSLGDIIEPAPLPSEVDKAILDAAGKTGTTPPAPGPVKSQAETDAEIALKAGQADIEKLRASMDSRAQGLIDGITREYDALLKQQEVANRAYEGGVTTEGLRAGRARYAPVMQGALIKQAVDQGLGQLERLQNKKQQLIMQAQQAKDENDLKALNATMTMYRDTIKEERALAQKTYENAMKASEDARTLAKEELASQNAVRDDARSSLSLIVEKFGGIDLENLDPITQKQVVELANTAGVPIETILGSSLAEDSAKRADLSNQISLASLSLRKQALAKTLEIDASEAQRLNLPRSVVGRTEAEINRDLASGVPPTWYIDALAGQGKPADTASAATAWIDFRNEALTSKSLVDFGSIGALPAIK